MGYHRAGFDVYGVDIEPQPDYPFKFRQGDALEILRAEGSRFDAIHASPPCQAYTTLAAGARTADRHPRLIPAVRDLLRETGLPCVIENVMNAPVRADLVLCGEMFRLSVIRHRKFELGFWRAPQPRHVAHRGKVRGWNHYVWHDGPYLAVYGGGGGAKGTVAEWQEAMGIAWTSSRHSIREAIPPAYTQYIGAHLLGIVA